MASPAPARAEAPAVTSAPTIEGTAEVGRTLTATGASWTPESATPSYRWQRCDAEGPLECSNIMKATGPTYVVTAEDLGSLLRVRLVVEDAGAESAPAYSEPVGPVGVTPEPTATATATAQPTATATAQPTATATAQPTATATAEPGATPAPTAPDTAAAATGAAQVLAAPVLLGTPRVGLTLSLAPGALGGLPQEAVRWARCAPSTPTCQIISGAAGSDYRVRWPDIGHRIAALVYSAGLDGPPPSQSAPTTVVPDPPMMRPFPTIRVTGRFTGSRTTLTRVAVRAPRTSRITTRCRPVRCTSAAPTGSRRRLAVLERRFAAGTIVEIAITTSGRYGKHVRMRMRSGAPPARVDACAIPRRTRAVTCPDG